MARAQDPAGVAGFYSESSDDFWPRRQALSYLATNGIETTTCGEPHAYSDALSDS